MACRRCSVPAAPPSCPTAWSYGSTPTAAASTCWAAPDWAAPDRAAPDWAAPDWPAPEPRSGRRFGGLVGAAAPVIDALAQLLAHLEERQPLLLHLHRFAG